MKQSYWPSATIFSLGMLSLLVLCTISLKSLTALAIIDDLGAINIAFLLEIKYNLLNFATFIYYWF